MSARERPLERLTRDILAPSGPIFIRRMEKYLLDGAIVVPKNSASYHRLTFQIIYQK